MEITVSKRYLFVVGLLTFGFIYMSLSFSTAFWISQVFMIFLLIYLFHEPMHVIIALERGVQVLEVNLGNKSHVTFTSVDDDNPKAEEIELQIYGGGFAVDFAGFLFVAGTCLLWGISHLDLIAIAFGIVIAVVFLVAQTIPGSDWQEIQKRLPKKVGA